MIQMYKHLPGSDTQFYITSIYTHTHTYTYNIKISYLQLFQSGSIINGQCCWSEMREIFCHTTIRSATWCSLKAAWPITSHQPVSLLSAWTHLTHGRSTSLFRSEFFSLISGCMLDAEQTCSSAAVTTTTRACVVFASTWGRPTRERSVHAGTRAIVHSLPVINAACSGDQSLFHLMSVWKLMKPRLVLTGSGCRGEWNSIACWERAEVGKVVTIPCPRVLKTVFGRNGGLLLTCIIRKCCFFFFFALSHVDTTQTQEAEKEVVFL